MKRFFSKALSLFTSEKNLADGLNGRQLCFMHIGKTAGTSFFYLLRETLADLLPFHGSPEAFDKVTKEELEKYDLITGHFSFVHTRKFRANRYLATFLRDPVERVLSSYYFLRQWDGVIDDSNFRMVELAKKLSLKAFLESDDPQVRSVTNNHQAYFLVSDFRAPRDKSDGELLEQAKLNLDHMDFVGFTEEYDYSVTTFFADIGRERPRGLRVMNATSRRARSVDLGSCERDLICRLNLVDLEVYKVAKKRFGSNRTPPENSASRRDN